MVLMCATEYYPPCRVTSFLFKERGEKKKMGFGLQLDAPLSLAKLASLEVRALFTDGPFERA